MRCTRGDASQASGIAIPAYFNKKQPKLEMSTVAQII